MSVMLGVTSAQELLGTMVSRLQRPVWQNALREAGLPEDKVQEACEKIATQLRAVAGEHLPRPARQRRRRPHRQPPRPGRHQLRHRRGLRERFSALHMAVNELHLGHSDAVVAGGVDTLNDIFMYMCFSKTPALSPQRRLRPFRHGRRHHARRGPGHGRAQAPRRRRARRRPHLRGALGRGHQQRRAQQERLRAGQRRGPGLALRRAYEHAGYSARPVELIEAHGTGTKRGRRRRVRRPARRLRRERPKARQWCALGTVKSQIGHTKGRRGRRRAVQGGDGAAHKVLPPTIKVERSPTRA
jgi:hypothetical protein